MPNQEQEQEQDNNAKNPNGFFDPTNDPPPKEPKKIFGSFRNVKLTDDEYEKLIEAFGDIEARQRIETLSEYLASKGKKYKSHYATILSWARKEGRYGKQELGSGSSNKLLQSLLKKANSRAG
jgi:hypothetical protein